MATQKRTTTQKRTKCIARTKNGTPCNNKPMKGQYVCRLHGGSTQQALRKGAERHAQDVITQQWVRLSHNTDLPPTDPVQSLLKEISWTAAFLEWIRIQLANLTPKDITWNTTRVVDKPAGTETTQTAETHALLKLLNEERDRLVRQTEVAIKLDLDRRLVESHEAVGRSMVAALEAGLVAAGLTPEQDARARAAMARKLRAIGAGGMS